MKLNQIIRRFFLATALFLAASVHAAYTFGPQVQSTPSASITYNSGSGTFQYTDTAHSSDDYAGLPLARNAAPFISTSNGWTATFTVNLSARSMTATSSEGPYVGMGLFVIVNNSVGNYVKIALEQANYTDIGDSGSYGTGAVLEAQINGQDVQTTPLGSSQSGSDGESFQQLSGGTSTSPATESINAASGVMTLTLNAATDTLTGYYNGSPVGSYSLASWGSNPSLTVNVVGYSGEGANVSAGTATASKFSVSAVRVVTPVKPTLAITSPARNAVETTAGFTIKGTTHDNVTVTGIVAELNGAPLTVISLNNFTTWTAFANPTPGTNTIVAYAQNSAGQSSTSADVVFFYNLPAKLSAGVAGGHGSLSPNYNGKPLDINRSYTMTALAGPGFEFSNWTVNGPAITTSISKPKLTFQMVTNLQLIANFVDIAKPAVTITTRSGRTPNAVFTIHGTAADNVGVAAVEYQVGEGPWNLAASADKFANWSAVVILNSGATAINVYAVDAQGNRSKTNSVTLVNEAAGFAPESLAGTTLTLLEATASQPVSMSFGPATFSYVGNPTTNFGVGSYTYTLMDANTAQVAFNVLAPGTSSKLATFSFANSGSGTYQNADGSAGTFTLGGAPSLAPESLNGVTLTGADTAAYGFSDVLGDGTFTLTQPPGTSSGTYSFAPFSPASGLLVETSASTVDYTLLNFGAASSTYETLSFFTDGSFNGSDSGTFAMSGQAATKGYKTPLSLANLVAAVTEVKANGTRRSFTVGFGAGGFGQFSGQTNQDNGVGIYSFVRTGPTTAQFVITYLTPPEAAANNGGTNALVFSGPRSASFADSESHGNITFSAAPSLAPVSLVGRKLRAVTTGNPVEVVSFSYGTFSGVSSDDNSAGNYTFATSGPEVAMVQLNYTGSKAGQAYVELWFSSATSGKFIFTQSSKNPQLGTFTLE